MKTTQNLFPRIHPRGLATYWLALILLCGFVPTRAQVFQDTYFRAEARKGLDYTYNFEFEKAAQYFEQLKTQYPTHPGPLYLLAFNRWWQSYISTTRAYHTYIDANLSQALLLNQSLAGKADHELEYTFFQYMIYAFQSRMHILKREWWSGANTGRKALLYLGKGIEYSAYSPEFYFSTGIYHYYAATYPAKHTYVKPLMVFFPEGNAILGLEELRKAAMVENFTQIESLYYLGDIYLEEEHAYGKALEVKYQLMRKYPRNTWFEADYARALVHDRQFESAEEMLSSIQSVYESIHRSDQRQITSLESRYTTLLMVRVYHYLGRIALEYHRDPVRAEFFLQKSQQMITLAGLVEYEYIAINLYWLGQVHIYTGDNTKAKQAFQSVLSLEDNGQVVREAQKALNQLD